MPPISVTNRRLTVGERADRYAAEVGEFDALAKIRRGQQLNAMAACSQGLAYIDLDHTPRRVADATKMLAANAAHLARLLKSAAFPGRA